MEIRCIYKWNNVSSLSLGYKRTKFGPIDFKTLLTSLNWIKFNYHLFISGFYAEL